MPAVTPVPVVPAADDRQAVQQQLARVLASRTFHPAERLKRFLAFIVSEALDGRADTLKEYVIAVQVFGKEDAFDPRTDPLVRVQARRLRARLERYYQEEGAGDALLIALPKGGYGPIIRPRPLPRADARFSSPSLAATNGVAVLDIDDQTSGGELGGFCRGLHDEVVHALARTGNLRVIVGGPAGGTDIRQVAEQLDVSTVIAGSARLDGGHVRAIVHVFDGRSGRCVWSEARTVDRDLAPGMQQDLASQLGSQLQGTDGPTGTRRLVRPTENLTAQSLYLQGRYHLNQRTEEGLQRAIDYFERAILEDPQFAQAHSGLSDAYGLSGHYAVCRPSDVWTRAASSATTAVMLDGDSAEARTSLAHVKATQDWDWLGAQHEYLQALALDPRYATAHHWYAMSCLVPLEDLNGAAIQMAQAAALDPISSIIARDLAMVRYYQRDFDAALEQCDYTIELNPHFSPAYWLLGFIQEQRGELDESIAAFQRAVTLLPSSPRMHSGLARALALAGRTDEARGLLHDLERMAARRYVSPFEFAVVTLALGQSDTAMTWLELAAEARAFEMTSLVVDPRLMALRQDPRFQALARRVTAQAGNRPSATSRSSRA